MTPPPILLTRQGVDDGCGRIINYKNTFIELTPANKDVHPNASQYRYNNNLNVCEYDYQRAKSEGGYPNSPIKIADVVVIEEDENLLPGVSGMFIKPNEEQVGEKRKTEVTISTVNSHYQKPPQHSCTSRQTPKWVKGMGTVCDDDEYDNDGYPKEDPRLLPSPPNYGRHVIPSMNRGGYGLPQQQRFHSYSSNSQPYRNNYHSNRPATPATTMMLRNIPNRWSTEKILATFRDEGFWKSFNFFYCPQDFRNHGCNMGYAFINFKSAEYAAQFKHKFTGYRMTNSPDGDAMGGGKICDVVDARVQGLEGNKQHYWQTCSSHGSANNSATATNNNATSSNLGSNFFSSVPLEFDDDGNSFVVPTRQQQPSPVVTVPVAVPYQQVPPFHYLTDQQQQQQTYYPPQGQNFVDRVSWNFENQSTNPWQQAARPHAQSDFVWGPQAPTPTQYEYNDYQDGCNRARGYSTASNGVYPPPANTAVHSSVVRRVDRQFNIQHVENEKSAQLPDAHKIFLGGLSEDTFTNDLYNYFAQIGNLVDCQVIVDRKSGVSRCIGFCTFERREDAQIALSTDCWINNRSIGVRGYNSNM